MTTGREHGDDPLARLDGSELCRELATPGSGPRRRSTPAAGRIAWLATSVAVLATTVAVAQSGSDGGATSAGNARGEAVQIQLRNRSQGETGLVTASDDYSLRLSNTKEGGGGGAVYGCRAPSSAPSDDRACLYADNLRGGEAFLFRSRAGTKVGHFDLGNPAGAPFSTNATGLVDNLNADRLDGLHATDIVGQARAKAGLAAETADTATTAGSATTAGDADTLDGAQLTDVATGSAGTDFVCPLTNALTFQQCDGVTVTLPFPGRALIVASGTWTSSDAAGNAAECELQLVADGAGVGPIIELGTDDVANHNDIDRGLGWSLTAVSPVLPAGARTFNVQARQPVGDCDLQDISTSAVVLGSG